MKKNLFALALILLSALLKAQDKFTDPRDGNSYSTATINGVTWMRENLRFSGLPGTYCFDNDKNNLPAYGALYEWETATKACPDGWHLPSGTEFGMLLNHFERKDTWQKGPSSESFNIQLGGQQDYEGVFSEVDESGYYWTATEYDKENAEYFSYMIIDGKKVIDISRKDDISDVRGSEKTNRYSVRCVKNQ